MHTKLSKNTEGRKEGREREGRRRKRGKEKGKGDFFLHNILSLR